MKYKIKGKFEELNNILEVELRVHINLIFHFHCVEEGTRKGVLGATGLRLLCRVQTIPHAFTLPFVFANLPRSLPTNIAR